MEQIKENERAGYTKVKGTYYKIWRRGNYLFCIIEKAIKQNADSYKLIETVKPATKEVYKSFELV